MALGRMKGPDDSLRACHFMEGSVKSKLAVGMV